jgi:hypothetical protein
VLVLLALAGAGTGALVGWGAGLVWLLSGLPSASTGAALAAAGVVAALDGVGRWRPPSVRRQVPQLWGRIFGARTVAVLYGARLGVGPATILATWLWWGAAAVAAACGPWVGALVGATFALVRTAVTQLAVAGPAEGGAMSRRMAGVRRADHPARTGVAVALVGLVLAAVLTGCSRDRDPAPASHVPLSADGTVSPTTTSTPPTPELRAMDDLLLDDALPGFHRDDAAVGAGPLDLEAAARAEADVAAERSVLETRGFVRGLSRAWIGPDDEVAYVAVYAFARADGAAAYLVDGMEHVLARGATSFPVAGIAGARGFTTVDDLGTTHAVVFTVGPRWVLVLVGSPSGTKTTDDAVGLASAQAARLPPG